MPVINPTKKWYRDWNLYKLLIMLGLLLSFMAAEFAVGFITNSLALMSDAFHMAADSLSIGVGILALLMSKREHPSRRFSYGLAGAETVGGLINGVFLLSVSFFIVLEAIQRFIDIPQVKNPLYVVYVASGGLAMNLFGMFLFMGHGGHGHSHGGHGHSHGSKTETKMRVDMSDEEIGSDYDNESLRRKDATSQEKEGKSESAWHLPPCVGRCSGLNSSNHFRAMYRIYSLGRSFLH